MATPISLTTGQVYLVGWSGTISGASLTLSGTLSSPTVIADTIKLDVANQDVIFVRGAAQTAAQRNGTNAQTFHVYQTYTSSTNYERFAIQTEAGGNVYIGTEKGSGGGTARPMVFMTNGSTRWTMSIGGNLNATGTMEVNTSGACTFGQITSSGHHLFTPDNTLTIGAVGATRPSIGYFGTSLFVSPASLGVSSADGLVLQNLTAAAAGAQQMSPRLRFDGFGWKTDATAASQAVSFINELLPVQAAAAPTASLLWKYAVNAGAYSTVLTLTSAGALVASEFQTASGAKINYNLSAYGVGTAYSLTNSAAAIDLGTTDPVVVLDKVGTYLISGQVNLAYTGATVATETATIKVRRTNNTAADLSAVVVLDLPVSTVLTHTYGIFQIPPFLYTTAATDDSITLFANVSAALGAGTIDATAIGTSLVAVRLY